MNLPVVQLLHGPAQGAGSHRVGSISTLRARPSAISEGPRHLGQPISWVISASGTTVCVSSSSSARRIARACGGTPRPGSIPRSEPGAYPPPPWFPARSPRRAARCPLAPRRRWPAPRPRGAGRVHRDLGAPAAREIAERVARSRPPPGRRIRRSRARGPGRGASRACPPAARGPSGPPRPSRAGTRAGRGRPRHGHAGLDARALHPSIAQASGSANAARNAGSAGRSA